MKGIKRFNLSQDLERGISETLSTAKNNIGQLRYEVIPLSRIKFDPTNPRKLALTREELNQPILETDPNYVQKKQELEKLRSMANSISKVGVRHAAEVYKEGSDYRLISGERRVLASLIAGKVDISVRILEHKPTELDLKFLQWVENMEREDLSTWEKVLNIRQLVIAHAKEKGGKISAIILGELLGCTRQIATIWLTAAEAPDDVLEALKKGKISNIEKTAFLAKIKDEECRSEILNACINNASLDDMRKLLDKGDVTKFKDEGKKGRPAQRVALGYVNNLTAMKKIMNAVLDMEECVIYKKELEDLNWNSFADISDAFKKIISYLEKRCK